MVLENMLTRVFVDKDVEIYTIEDFLDYEECKYLVNLIESKNEPSRVTAQNEQGEGRMEEYRTSSSCFMSNENNPFVKRIEDKIKDALPEPPLADEGIQGQKYEIGQFFKVHHDYFDPNDKVVYDKHTKGRGGQRTWTFMIYLNDVFSGGETEFPELDIRFTPKRGMAVIWKNLKDDGQGNPLTMHQGLPPISNTKYIITKWFRSGEEQLAPNTFTDYTNIPRFTTAGFEVRDIPTRTFNLIKEAYKLLLPTIQVENWDDKYSFIKSDKGESSEFLNFEQLPEIRRLVHEQLQPIHEEWTGTKLEPTYIYGIRSYKDGATLASHVDRIQTHHISCIILVDENSRKPWPLDIKDHFGIWHKVVIKPGQMILYESAACEHARLEPFEGEYFRNFFVHYKLKDWTYVA